MITGFGEAHGPALSPLAFDSIAAGERFIRMNASHIPKVHSATNGCLLCFTSRRMVWCVFHSTINSVQDQLDPQGYLHTLIFGNPVVQFL